MGQSIGIIDQKYARDILYKAMSAAHELGARVCIAVVDNGGNLLSFLRMDDAWIGSIDVSIKKARTARFFDVSTLELGKLTIPGGPLYGIEHSNDGLITFPGGVPILDDRKQVIGAIGVSGSTVENDDSIARAGAATTIQS